MKKILYIIAAITVLASCEGTIDYTPSDSATKIILNGLIHTGESRHTISMCLSDLQTVRPVNEGEIYCTVNGGKRIAGVRTPYSGRDQLDFVFDMDLKPGDHVLVEAYCKGMSCRAEVDMPETASVKSAEVKDLKDKEGEYDLDMTLSDRVGGNDYFLLYLMEKNEFTFRYDEGLNLPDTTVVIGSSIGYDIGNDPVLNDGYQTESSVTDDLFADMMPYNVTKVFSDRFFTDSECNVSVRFFSSYKYVLLDRRSGYWEYPAESVSKKSTILVRLVSIGKEYYDYLRAFNSFYPSEFEYNPLIEPVEIPSNVEGGLGFIGAGSAYDYPVVLYEGVVDGDPIYY